MATELVLPIGGRWHVRLVPRRDSATGGRVLVDSQANLVFAADAPADHEIRFWLGCSEELFAFWDNEFDAQYDDL